MIIKLVFREFVLREFVLNVLIKFSYYYINILVNELNN